MLTELVVDIIWDGGLKMIIMRPNLSAFGDAIKCVSWSQ